MFFPVKYCRLQIYFLYVSVSDNMERRSFFYLLLILLALSHLIISTTAVSFSRAQRLLQQSKSLQGLGDTFHKAAQMSNLDAYKAKGDELTSWRMDIEINDYPGSGPNNRHTPPQPPEKN